VQYQYAKQDAKINIFKPTSNFGAAVFADYTFGTSPYSIGGWVEYFDSHASASDQAAGSGDWFIAPDAEAIGAAVSPTWQYKDLFARANAGYLYLLHNEDADGDTSGFGSNGTNRGQFIGTLEAGLLF
jgi:Putative beta-barrel porin-2, OmpL-like. bbp2